MSQSIHVVIAEDDKKIAEIQRRFVERVQGYEVVGIAYTTRDAIDLIDVLEPDLVLLDVYFPDNSGLELLRQIRSNNALLDVILITAAKEVDTLQTAMHLGVYDYILKPLVFDRLQEALKSYQDHRFKLKNLDSLSQQTVDRFLNSRVNNNESKAVLPKGIDALTLNKVKQVFVNKETNLSAEQVGEHVGMSRTTARRYLEFLVTEQVIKADISYGTVGRPERRYCALKT